MGDGVEGEEGEGKEGEGCVLRAFSGSTGFIVGQTITEHLLSECLQLGRPQLLS